ncbi:MAG: DNA polymerase III subunit delta' [Alphaproteobacteria bacterium]|nr:DNA polymerase III subunit delta' [Alphaproteobacteria bacterium]
MNLFGDEDLIFDDDPQEDDVGYSPVPEDSVSELCEPALMDFCLGHEQIENQFLDLYKKDKMPHAVVFSGAQGIGKTTFAFRLARFLLKSSKDTQSNQEALFGIEESAPDVKSLDIARDDPVFSRVASGGHADLMHLKRDEGSNALRVDEVRGIERFLRKTSSEGGYRIVIIEDADTMNRNAQNAILKILEEPPKMVLLILIAHRSGMLIPTIRSRTRFFEFRSLSEGIILDALRREGKILSEKESQRLLTYASGSIGKALNFTNEGGLDMLSEILNHIEKNNQTALHKFSQSISGKGQEASYYLFADIMQWIFRLMLSAKARGDYRALENFSHDIVTKMVGEYSLEKLIGISSDLREHFQSVDFSNLDKRDAVRRAFLMLSQ